jgi:hypothetical protein
MMDMKTMRSVAAFALIASFGMAGTAAAQCTLDATENGGVGPIAVPGNTCGKNLSLLSICGGGDPTNGLGTSVVQLNLSGTPNFGLQVVSSTAGFNPELAFTTGSCSSLSGCTVDDTNGTQTVPASGAGTGYSDTNFDGPVPQPAAGTGFVFITDLVIEAPGCGSYTLNIAGNLPVKLQNFSVQ